MKVTWIGAVVGVAALTLGGMATIGSSAQAAQPAGSPKANAPRHYHSRYAARPYIEPHYYARPTYYRPYPYALPLPFFLGFGFGPWW
jgi:hypothetical protein